MEAGSSNQRSKDVDDVVTVKVSETTPLLSQSGGSSKNKGKGCETRIRHGRGPIYDAQLNDDDYVEPSSSTCRYFLVAIATFIALAGLTIAAAALISPQMAHEIAGRNAIVVDMKDARLVRVDNDGVVVRIHAAAGLDLDRIHGSWAYSFVQLGTFFFRSVETQPSNMHVYGLVNGTEKEIGYFQMDKINIPVYNTNSLTMVDAETKFHIGDGDSLAALAEQAILDNKAIGKVKGPVQLKIGLIPITIPGIEIPIEMQGLGGVPKFDIKELNFTANHPDGGIAIEALATVDNPTQFGANIGNVDLGVYLPSQNDNEVLLAVARAINVSVIPGKPIYVHLYGRALPLTQPNDILDQKKGNYSDPIEQFLARYMRGLETKVLIRGSPFDKEGGSPEWLKKILRKVSVSVNFPGAPQNEFVKDIKVRDFKFNLPRDGGDIPVASGYVSGKLNLPENMKISINVTALRPDLLLYNASLNDPYSTSFGRLTVSELIPAKTFQRGNETYVEAHMTDVPMQILPGKGAVFREFVAKVVFGGGGRVGLNGTSEAKVETGLGRLTLRDMPIKGEFDINSLFTDILR